MAATETIEVRPDLAAMSQSLDIAEVQAFVIDAAATINDETIDAVAKADLGTELNESLSVIRDYLWAAEGPLVVRLSESDNTRPSARMQTLMGEFGNDREKTLVVPRQYITGLILNALWGGDDDCTPVADVRIVVHGKDPDIRIFREEPKPSAGSWSRFALGRLAL